MEAKRLIKYFLLCGSVYFTVICGSTLFILELLTSSMPNAAVEPSQLLLIIPLSFTMSLGSTVRRISAIPKIWGRVANAVCYIGGFAAFLLMCGVPFTSAIAAVGIFAALYAAVAAIIAFIEKKKSVGSYLSQGNKEKRAANTKSIGSSKTAQGTASTDKKQKGDKKPYENMFS